MRPTMSKTISNPISEAVAAGVTSEVPRLAKDIKEKVHRYYDATTEDYLKYYQTDWHHHMHFGFDRDLPKGGNPTEHLVRYLAKIAGLKAGDAVLDSGCGV